NLLDVWAEEEEVMCLHPNGVQLDSLESIRESWRGILSNPARIHLRGRPIARWRGSLIAVHQIVENLDSSQDVSGVFHVTHVYLRGPLGWRLACRHSSHGANEPVFKYPSQRVLH
ncbi:MAG: nuclear transport factor 2 family protein, partial [Zoogloeaceae bacterium]|nr:nuclear transport factor 2 family protein [Zoogloeaceae bacterium]